MKFWKTQKKELPKSSNDIDHYVELGYDYLGYDEFHWTDSNGKITENIYAHFLNKEDEKYLRVVYIFPRWLILRM